MDADKKKIIIAGTGFGGLSAALELASKKKLIGEHDIVLIDRNRHQLFTPALYEIAALPRTKGNDSSLKTTVLIPVADIIEGKPIIFCQDELTNVKIDEKKIVLKNGGQMPYEFLILALGSETNYFDIPGLKEYGLPLKSFEDALKMRNSLEDILLKKGGLKIVVVGGGPSGIELIAEFVNFVCLLKKELIKEENKCVVEFMLVEAYPEILPGFKPWIIKQTRRRLDSLGIRIKTGTTITALEKQEIVFKNWEREPYDILIWTGGVTGPIILKETSLPLSHKGSILIDEYLRVQGQNDHLFAVGDNSTLLNHKTGKHLIWNVPIAEAEGKLAAKNIIRTIQHKPLRKFIPLKNYPFVLAVGEKYAIADLVFIRVWGLLGWFIKQLIELRYFLFILPTKKALLVWLRGLKYFTAND